MTPKQSIEQSPKKASLRKLTANGGAGAPKSDQALMFETVSEVFGLDAKTERQRKRIGKAASEFVQMEATPGEVRVRAGRYRDRWPNQACTPEAVAKHWSLFAEATDANPARVRDDFSKVPVTKVGNGKLRVVG